MSIIKAINLSRFPVVLVTLTVILNLAMSTSSLLAQGKKGSGNPTYTLTDLQGLPGYALQSDGRFITNRNSNRSLLIGGTSHQYVQGGPAQLCSVVWEIAVDGTFPNTDPQNLGIPGLSREVVPTGINSFGIVVVDTNWAGEQDSDGNWLFPSYAHVPGVGYRELPGGLSRTTQVGSINDDGWIVGTLAIADPEAPDGNRYVGGLWHVDLLGNITEPILLGDFGPVDINNDGVMAGYSIDLRPAIAWFENGSLQMRVLDSSLRYWGANTYALNDWPAYDSRLTVVGTSTADETGNFDAPSRGFAWRPFDAASPTTVLNTLGGLESFARDVNRDGQIVGWSDTKEQRGQASLIGIVHMVCA